MGHAISRSKISGTSLVSTQPEAFPLLLVRFGQSLRGILVSHVPTKYVGEGTIFAFNIIFKSAGSFEDSIRASRSQILLNLRGIETFDDSVNLGVVVVETRFGIFVLGWKTGDIAVLLLGAEAGCCCDAGVGHAGTPKRSAGSNRC